MSSPSWQSPENFKSVALSRLLGDCDWLKPLNSRIDSQPGSTNLWPPSCVVWKILSSELSFSMKSFLFLMNRFIVLEGEFARVALGRARWVEGYRSNTPICLLSAEIGWCRSSCGRQMNSSTHWGDWKRCSNTGQVLGLFTYMTDAEETEGKKGEC